MCHAVARDSGLWPLLCLVIPAFLMASPYGCDRHASGNGPRSDQTRTVLGKDDIPDNVGPAVRTQIEALLSSDSDVKVAAAARLRGMGPPADDAVPFLIQVLESDENARVRGAAACAFAYLRDSRAVEPLKRALAEDPDPVVRKYAATALAATGGDISDVLLAGLNDSNADVRAGVARAIGDMWPNRKATVPLIGLLDDANVEVRRAAICALWSIWAIDGDPRTVDPLVNALGDEDAEMRRAGAAGLMMSKTLPQRAVEPLVGVLRDTDPEVRRYAASALGKVSSPRVLAALLGALQDRSEDVRASVAVALGKSGNSQAVDPLIQRLRDESEHVRICVASALKIITGQDLGTDYAKWDRWRREQQR